MHIWIGKSASAGASAITKKWGAVRKCVRKNYQSAGVRAPHSKIPSNPTSVHNNYKWNCKVAILQTNDIDISKRGIKNK